MKPTMKKAVFAILLAFAPMLAFAQQNTLTQTTLSAVVTSSANIITVASATGITAPTGAPGTATSLYVLDSSGAGELMTVTAVNGTAISVTRGSSGTAGQSHISGAMVLVGRPNWFYVSNPGGSCTAANVLASPYVNIRTGDEWLCSTQTLSWVPGFNNDNALIGLTATVASVAGTTTPSGPFFHISGTNAITAWGIPVGCNATTGGSCSFTVIPDAAFTTTATNNIATAVTAVANLAQIWTWDSKNSKFVVIQSK